MLYVSVQYYITDDVKMYDSLHLHTVYSATDKILRVQFPTQCALLECCLQFFFGCYFCQVSFSKGFKAV